VVVMKTSAKVRAVFAETLPRSIVSWVTERAQGLLTAQCVPTVTPESVKATASSRSSCTNSGDAASV